MLESVGVLIINDDSILACKPFGRDLYDLPKGIREFGESRLDTMLRELREETGIVINHEDIDKLEFCGTFKYIKGKNLSLYKFYTNFDINKCRCDSQFELDGNMVPEIVGYKWIPFEDINLFFKSLQPIIKKLIN